MKKKQIRFLKNILDLYRYQFFLFFFFFFFTIKTATRKLLLKYADTEKFKCFLHFTFYIILLCGRKNSSNGFRKVSEELCFAYLA